MKRAVFTGGMVCAMSMKRALILPKSSQFSIHQLFPTEDQHDLVRSDSVLQRKHPTFVPRLSIFATASDVSHCEDAAHVSHKNEPGHAEEQ